MVALTRNCYLQFHRVSAEYVAGMALLLKVNFLIHFLTQRLEL